MTGSSAAAQTRAADPAHSVWVTANAGSGKTRVLTDRVARLLLQGVAPDGILCLTYTKAAATEMQNRLFARLGDWSMQADAALARALAELGIPGALGADRLAQARRLFAQAIDTPGGLRILTIHAFCAAVLRRFPLEAGLTPRFTEMDDRTARLMRSEIVADMAGHLAPAAVAALAAAWSGEDFDAVAAEVAGDRAAYAPPLTEAQVRARFGVPDGESEARILDDTFVGGEADVLAELVAHLARGLPTDRKNGDALEKVDLDPPAAGALDLLQKVFLWGNTKDPGKSHTAKTDGFPTKDVRNGLGALQGPLQAFMRRVQAARARRVALAAATRTAALHAFAAAFLPEYAARKAARGLLDFDDLILRTHALLSDPAVAPWVLFRLDGGIAHILVDEAQDTSPLQWGVVERLAAEFTTGEGAQAGGRTLFVVGDRKQSIYSFQGADLRVFAAQERAFADRFSALGTPLRTEALQHSFRSAPAVLRLVDAVFDPARGWALDGPMQHTAFFDAMPGKVEVLPPIPRAEKADPDAWYNPVDLPNEEHHMTVLGHTVAARIKAMIDGRALVPERRDGQVVLRPVRAGDFLVLVRRRSAAFAEVLRACKAAKLPVAGADRLRLGAELAVRDLTALLSFVALQEDDLSLAAVLRSPLVGLSEAALYRLAQGRAKKSLWDVLRATMPPEARAMAMLTDLRDQSDFLRPYDLLARILIRHDGRRRLIARLGAEAADGIDELLTQALAYERAAVPSLTGFLVWLDADRIDVKRQAGGAGDRIRIMTVHGAKGLEAPVVILPDTAKYQARDRGVTLPLPDGTPAWKPPADASPALLSVARADRKADEAAESLRLLYVAMTRAQSRLIVAAAGDLGKEVPEGDDPPPPAWYHLIRAGMTAAGARDTSEGGQVLWTGDWTVAPEPQATAPEAPAPPLPGWLDLPAPAASRPPVPVAPSALGGAKALGGEGGLDEDLARARGTVLHRLLEHLPAHPRDLWPALAASLPGADADLLAEAAGVLDAPGLAHLFAPGTLAEVPFAADLNGRRLAGSIDRLVIAPDHVLAVDFKSNRTLPAGPAQVPDGVLRQMGAYAHALQQIYPGRRIDTAILWTRGPLLMPLPPDIVRGALARATIP